MPRILASTGGGGTAPKVEGLRSSQPGAEMGSDCGAVGLMSL